MESGIFSTACHVLFDSCYKNKGTNLVIVCIIWLCLTSATITYWHSLWSLMMIGEAAGHRSC